MRVVETKVYQYAELSDAAKAKARDWWREASAGDNDFADCITDDLKEAAKAAGWSIGRRHGRDDISWSGFWSQGDGACFGGTWSAKDVDIMALIADRPESYNQDGKTVECKSNKELARILREFERIAKAFPESSGSSEHNSRYSHSRSVTLYWSNDAEDAEAGDFSEQDNFAEAARDLMDWFYKALETEYEYQNSDEVVAETIDCNGYEFTEDGQRA